PKSVSQQIDVLVYDSSKPILFKDGDLVFLASDATRAIIEVKAAIRSQSKLLEAVEKLARKAEFLYEQTPGDQFRIQPPFVGLFSYEWWEKSDRQPPIQKVNEVLDALHKAANGKNNRNPHTRIVNHVTLGPSFFVRYWEREPASDRGANYCRW